MPRTRFHLTRLGQLALAVLGGAGLLGPTVAAFAESPPAVASAMRRPHAVIRVHPFLDLARGDCLPTPPVHRGPVRSTGRIGKRAEWELAGRMDMAASRCLEHGTPGHLVLAVSVDARGRITHFEALDRPSSNLAACAGYALGTSDDLSHTGPARITIGYFMGKDGSR